MPTFQIGSASLGAGYALTTNRWYHLAFTRNVSGQAVFHIDGKLWSQNSAFVPGVTTYVDAGISLGRLHRTPTSGFLGELSEVRVWSVARTQPEIVGAMRRRLDVCAAPGLIAYWPLNQTQESLALDMAGGAHGTLDGPVWEARGDTPFLVPSKPDYPKGTLLSVR